MAPCLEGSASAGPSQCTISLRACHDEEQLPPAVSSSPSLAQPVSGLDPISMYVSSSSTICAPGPASAAATPVKTSQSRLLSGLDPGRPVPRHGRVEGIHLALDCSYVVEVLRQPHVGQLAAASVKVPHWSAVGVALRMVEDNEPVTPQSLRQAVLRSLAPLLATAEDAPPPKVYPLTTDTQALAEDYLQAISTSIFAGTFTRELRGDPVVSQLRPEQWWKHHRRICAPCQTFPVSYEEYKPLNHCNGCCISTILASLHYGYLPALQAEPDVSKVPQGNARSVGRAPKAVAADIDRRVRMGWASPADPAQVRCHAPLTVSTKRHEVACLCQVLRQHLPELAHASDAELAANWDDLRALRDRLPEELQAELKLKIRTCYNAAPTVNAVMDVRHFSYPAFLRAVAPILPGHHMWKIDLADMYMQLPLHPAARPYFGFRHPPVPAVEGDRWPVDPVTGMMSFVCNAVQFGQNDGSVYANMLTGHCLQFLWALGLSMEAMTDDFMGSGEDYGLAEGNKATALGVLHELGWITNGKVTDSLLELEFLGIVINSTQQTLSLSAARVEAERLVIRALLAQTEPTISKRDLQSLAGRLSFFAQVMLKGRAFTSSLHQLTGQVSHPEAMIKLSTRAVDDLKAWLQLLDQATDAGAKPWTRILRRGPVAVVRTVSDASSAHGAAIMVGDRVVRMRWDHPGMNKIGGQEMLPLLVVLQEFGPALRGSLLVYSTDNVSVAYGVNKGCSRDETLNTMLRTIYELAEQYDIVLLADHIPREENVLSDAMSKGATYEEALAARLCAITL